MSYAHLAQEERYQIRAMLDADCTIRDIARVLGRCAGTISRELSRNRGLRGYRPGQADRFASERAAASRCRHRITTRQWTEISRLIRLDWSPEQISARAALEDSLDISPEWIYQFVYADKAVGGDLWRHLRCQRKRRKRYGSGRERRGRIPDRVGIEARPADVDTRETMGHWEGDTIIGKGHRGAAMTVVERKSRLLRMGKLPGKSARAMRQAFKRRLGPMAEAVRSITFDNGKEFSQHRLIGEDLNSLTYFADPYASWQRGTNENTNGLIRQYLPKSRNLETLTGGEIRMIEHRINNRPRKCNGYLTANEVAYNYRVKLTVALRS